MTIELSLLAASVDFGIVAYLCRFRDPHDSPEVRARFRSAPKRMEAPTLKGESVRIAAAKRQKLDAQPTK